MRHWKALRFEVRSSWSTDQQRSWREDITNSWWTSYGVAHPLLYMSMRLRRAGPGWAVIIYRTRVSRRRARSWPVHGAQGSRANYRVYSDTDHIDRHIPVNYGVAHPFTYSTEADCRHITLPGWPPPPLPSRLKVKTWILFVSKFPVSCPPTKTILYNSWVVLKQTRYCEIGYDLNTRLTINYLFRVIYFY